MPQSMTQATFEISGRVRGKGVAAGVDPKRELSLLTGVSPKHKKRGILTLTDRKLFESGRAQPQSMTLPRSSMACTNSARFWTAAVLCRFHPL